MKTFTDFEGNELHVGDKVLTVDIEKRGGAIRRGEIVKLCDTCVKIKVEVVCNATKVSSYHEIQRISGWIALVEQCTTPKVGTL